jgi:hypothetical protein
MAVRIEKIIATILDEAHKRQAEEVMETLSEGSEGFYRCSSCSRACRTTPGKGELATLSLPPVLAVDKPSGRKYPRWIGG